jgi:hypothetical protein
VRAVNKDTRHFFGGYAERAQQIAHRTRLGGRRMPSRRSIFRKRSKTFYFNGVHTSLPKQGFSDVATDVALCVPMRYQKTFLLSMETSKKL